MKRQRTAHGVIARSFRTLPYGQENGRAAYHFDGKARKVPPFVFADPVTGFSNQETEIRDVFRDTIRGSVYDLYEKRGWEPETE